MTTAAHRLDDLLAALTESEVRGDTALPISGVAYRSAEVRPGFLFFCVPGTRRDGHGFAADAIGRGASALMVERWLDVPGEVVQVLVPSVRAAMGPVAAEIHGRPSERLLLAGVTGTNGKTTTTYLLEAVMRAAGIVPGVIGTTGVRIAGEPHPLDRTTPEAPDLHALLARMLEAGVEGVAMEVSSHGLDQHRVGGLRFACAVFTNLTQDHLDYHDTLESYFEAKSRLFTPELAATAAVNIDDPHGRRLLDVRVPTITFGLGEGADVRAADVELKQTGSAFSVDGRRFHIALRGGFNVSNALAAIAAGRQLGLSDEAAAEGLANVEGVPGRFETVDRGQPFQVLVDYAHTPDSVENVLRAARELTEGRVVIVIGCGGDRDRGKRPLMGEAATSLADLAVITSDNPRSEDPAAIIDEILPGARMGGGSFVVEADRRLAIRHALSEAKPGDVVVIAGKGHESGQELADRTIPFDDRTVAAEELEALP